jgi:hypothetical protein
MFKYNLGIEAECRVTKIKGIVVSRSDNLNGCNRYFIQPKAGKDMKMPNGYWLDENDVVEKDRGFSKNIDKEEKKRPGGPLSMIR